MCGRYALVNGKMIFQLFGKNHLGSRKDELDDLPRYNAAPMQRMPVVAVRNGDLVLQKMQWWLVPHWSKDGKIKSAAFNAKAETLDQNKLFAPYFRSSRCLIPADAFYEWKNLTVQKEVRGKMLEMQEKLPMCIRMKNGKTFMFAGLFSVWRNEKGEEFPSFTIITTTPNKLMAEVHTRMPVILEEKDFDGWLDRNNKDIDALNKLLISYPASQMEVFSVSKYVNNSRNEGPECMKKVG
jgi:putative SOS response-associated peptidase YedK